MERPSRKFPVVGGLAAVVLFAGVTLAQTANGPSPGTAAKAQAPGSAAAPAAGAKADAKAPSKEGSAAKAAPANPKNSGSYSLGVSMGEQLHRAGMDAESVSVERLAQGLRDALAGKAKMGPTDQENIATLVRGTRSKLGDVNHTAAKSFLAENGKKKDIVTTASGLQYKVLAPGSGDSPKSTDQVTVNYRGTLLDGTEFDSSYKRGQPASFPVNGVIPGWQEALVLMKPGAKWQIFVPPTLAYDLDSPPSIPPGSLLVFDVELLSVKPPQPQQASPGQPQQASPGQPQIQPQQQPQQPPK
ncbi:MAG: FKBP-type peptidyl-prolyl cis-trans isomerase [Gammaproteobacteria bacterium]|nr:MAG: FKBP-type peptidyl-prolyl cis-trans isomerase [Gammaproteobacteria bacterium]